MDKVVIYHRRTSRHNWLALTGRRRSEVTDEQIEQFATEHVERTRQFWPAIQVGVAEFTAEEDIPYNLPRNAAQVKVLCS